MKKTVNGGFTDEKQYSESQNADQKISALSFISSNIYTLWISRCIATAKERIPGSIDNYVTGVSECSQQRGNLKDNGYIIVQTSLVTNPALLLAVEQVLTPLFAGTDSVDHKSKPVMFSSHCHRYN